MKILIVSQYYYPEQFQINEIAPALVKEGHQVTVLTGLPNYPKGEIYEGYKNGHKAREVMDGVEVIRVKEHPRKKGVLHLLWNYFSFVRNGNRKVKKLKGEYDIVLMAETVFPAVWVRRFVILEPRMNGCVPSRPLWARERALRSSVLPTRIVFLMWGLLRSTP